MGFNSAFKVLNQPLAIDGVP